MSKILLFCEDYWRIFIPLILIVGCLNVVHFSANESSVVNAGSECSAASGVGETMSLANTTFLKSYRLLVFTKINGAWPTKDGGYIVSGTTDPNIMFVPPDGFVAKLDKQGNAQWVKLLKTTNSSGGNLRGDEDVQSIIELKSGGYMLVSKVWGFIKSSDWTADNTELNKIMFTKLDKNGKSLWSKSFTGFVEDTRNSVLETADNGFLFYTSIVDLLPDDRGEDSDVYQDIPFASLKVMKMDQNGNLKWAKNIPNFISRENEYFLTTTADGGYAVAGDLTEPNTEKAAPYDYDSYPAIAKFDADFNFQWGKTLEGTPLEMAAAIPNGTGGYTLGWKQYRQGASIIHAIIRTEDNGFLVLGNGPTSLSLVPNLQVEVISKQSGLIGYKYDKDGNLSWVKKMTLDFNEFSMPMSDFSAAATVDNNLMIVGPITWADDDYSAKVKNVTDLRNWYAEKYGELELMKEAGQKSAASKADWKKVAIAIQIATEAYRAGVFMMKTDQNLVPVWSKIANPQRGATNYVLKPTMDSGAIIAGEYVTNVVQSIMFGEKIYYKDGFLIKLDASGNVKDSKGWLIDYTKPIVSELMTPYSLTNKITAQVTAYSVKLTSRVPTFSTYSNTKTSTYAAYKSAKTTLCPVAPNYSGYDNPLQNTVTDSTETRTWPQINYERAVPVETVNEKSATIHGELLPILNAVYSNKVKLTDNMGGAMLSYLFDRIITAEDKTAIKVQLESVGYKTYDETGTQLTMYKPGYFLVMTFAVNNRDKAFLDVTY